MLAPPRHLLVRIVVACLLAAVAVAALSPSLAFLSLDAPTQRRALDDPSLVRDQLRLALPDVIANALPTTHAIPGLDLQGGVQLTLKVDVDRAIAAREAGAVDVDPVWRERLSADAVNQAHKVVKKRIDALHVAEPSITRRGDRHLQVQLPGSTDPGAARALLGRTAQLAFHRVVADDVSGRVDPSSLPPSARQEDRSFVDRQGQVQSDHTVTFDVADRDVVVGVLTPLLPPGQGLKVGPAGDSDGRLRTYVVEAAAAVGGDAIAEAFVGQGSPEDPGPVVIVRFDARGTEAFAALTTRSVGQQIAIVLDDVVDSAPVVSEPITGGTASIRVGSGVLDERLREANELAAVLQAGALLAPLVVVEERTIGPTLGVEAAAGVTTAGLVAVVLVAAFMALVYRAGGVYAAVAAVANVVLVLAALSAMGAALTLPGLAGLILTVGMAVDANIVIQERVAEEWLLTGSRREATARGYGRAWSAIIDSNVASFIAGVACLELGSGPVQSFAVALLLGIGATLLTAVSLTRLLHDVAFACGASDTKPVRVLRFVPRALDVDWLRHGRAFVIGSASVVAAIVVGGAIFGVPTSVDFAGGIEAVVTTSADATADGVKTALSNAGLHGAQLQTVTTAGDDASTTWQIRVEAAEGTGAAALQAALAPAAHSVSVLQVDSVDGAVADDLARDGVTALIATLIGILAYVAVRFDRWFAPGAVIALLHDPLGALFVFVGLRLELDLPSVAALLTTVGYSISHTIVIYDRVRETMPAEPAEGLAIETVRAVVSRAVSDTLQRTIATTVTVLITTTALWIWGGPALRSFSVALTAGCLVGAWSSLAMAPTIYVWLRQRFPKRATSTPAYSRAQTAEGVV